MSTTAAWAAALALFMAVSANSISEAWQSSTLGDTSPENIRWTQAEFVWTNKGIETVNKKGVAETLGHPKEGEKVTRDQRIKIEGAGRWSSAIAEHDVEELDPSQKGQAAAKLAEIEQIPESSWRPWQPHIRSDTHKRKQWFGSDLGAAHKGSEGHKRHVRHHQMDGFMLDEIRERHQAQTHKVRLIPNAGIPILQAAMMKPSPRSSEFWEKDPVAEDPGDEFRPPPLDPEEPGDALLQTSVVEERPLEKKPSILRREVLPETREAALVDTSVQTMLAPSPASSGAPSSDCERCMDCSGAVPNDISHENYSADQPNCICFKWTEWKTKKLAIDPVNGSVDGIYPGVYQGCIQHVVPDGPGCHMSTNTTLTAGLNCASLNCSCDLNVYWNLTAV